MEDINNKPEDYTVSIPKLGLIRLAKKIAVHALLV